MKSAIIVGASGGIGRFLTRGYLQQGYRLSLVGRDSKRLMELIQELQQQGFSTALVHAIAADVSKVREVENLFVQHQQKFQTLPTVLINLAAQQGPLGPVWKIAAESWFNAIEQNLFPAFLLTQQMINNALAAQHVCSIIHFSGGGSAYARPYFSAYGCSKTAILRLVETVSYELQEQGLNQFLQINAVAPGAVRTQMTEEVLSAGKDCVGEKAFNEAAQL